MINQTVASALQQGAVQAAADGSENPDIPPVAVEHIDRLCAMAAVLLEVPFVAVVWAAKGTRFQQRCWVHGKADDPDQREAICRLCASPAPGGAAVTVRDLHQSSSVHPLPAHGSLIRAYAGVPLMTPAAQLIGHLYAMDLVSRLWSERELRILTTLCSLVALAIKLSEAASESDLRLQAITAEREAQDEMLADIAHDLRQPLAVISLTAELLGRDDPRCREQKVEMLRGAARTMATLISELLAGDARSTLDLRPVSPASLIRKAVASLTPLAARRGLRLEGSMDEGLPAVDCDQSKVQRVYSNLVGNAIQHAAPSSVIRLEGRQVIDGVRFSVINDGPGIAAGDAPHVFERGWQACHQGDGHGLGLAIVRKLVEAQGGSVAVRSVAGTTSFCFTLPLSPVPVPMNDTELEAQSA